MKSVKIAVIGAGSYVFGPSVVHDVLIDRKLADAHVALVDLDAAGVESLAGAAERIGRDVGVGATFSAHTRREEALDRADFVICCASVQMHKRFALDCQIVDQFIPGHQVSEFGGVAGISYSLRQIALIEKLAQDMLRLCPGAWLLDVANPMPRVCQAAHEAGVKTVGMCSVSLNVYCMLSRILLGKSERYPYAEARGRFEAFSAGLNHFAFLLGVKDRQSGADLMPALEQKRKEGACSGEATIDRVWRQTGYLLTSADDHVRDFLAPAGPVHNRGEASHGSGEERQRRMQYLADIATGKADWRELMSRSCWEKPVDIVAAMAFGQKGSAHSLSLINEQSISNLPRNIFAETPCTLSSAGATPMGCTLPEAVLPLQRQAAEVTDRIVRAARERSRKRVYEAVELDPTIIDKAAGRRAMEECLRVHAEVLPAYR